MGSMTGKHLIGKNLKPSFVFAAGVFVVLFILSYFIVLHISAIDRVNNINAGILKLNQTIVVILSDYSDENGRIGEVEQALTRLYALPGMDAVVRLYPQAALSGKDRIIRSKNDVLSLYEKIMLLYEKIRVHTMKMEKAFRILYIFILLVVVTMFLFLGVSQFDNYRIIRDQQRLNELNGKLYDHLEKERSFLAFELHDDIAQKLAVIKRYFSNRNSIDERTILMETYASEIIKKVRYMSRMLKAPANLADSFQDNLETLFSDFNVLSGFRLNRKTVGLNALRLTPVAALHIYRIVQEVLTNSRIHSDATEIELLLVYSHPTLSIQYRDNGKGFDPYLVYRKGIGQDSIKYRIDLLDGDYRIKSAEGEGTEIFIDIPVELWETS